MSSKLIRLFMKGKIFQFLLDWIYLKIAQISPNVKEGKILIQQNLQSGICQGKATDTTKYTRETKDTITCKSTIFLAREQIEKATLRLRSKT